jgi:Na+-driven multidrug efflux pump
VVTPALIRGWGGLPQLGVASGAWATVVSFVVATPGWPSGCAASRARWRPTRSLCAPAHQAQAAQGGAQVGVPTGVQMIVVALAEVVLLSMVNSYGSNATAAYGAVNQVVAYVQFPAISIAITASILGAQAIGAGRADRLGAITRTACR